MKAMGPVDNEKELHITGSDIEVLANAIGGSRARDAVLTAIGEISAGRLGTVVFTASVCRAASMEIERIFSSTASTYAVGVATNKRETQWGQHVLKQRKVFIGEGPLAMAAAFDDQEAMSKAGVRSIINIPILLSDQCVGVLNFGFGTDRVSPSIITAVRCLGLAATAGFAAHVAQRESDGHTAADESADPVFKDPLRRRAGEPQGATGSDEKLPAESNSTDFSPSSVRNPRSTRSSTT